MANVRKINKKQKVNEYKKVLDDAKHSLKSFEDMDFLDDIPDDSKPVGQKVVFPYGGYRNNLYYFASR